VLLGDLYPINVAEAQHLCSLNEWMSTRSCCSAKVLHRNRGICVIGKSSSALTVCVRCIQPSGKEEKAGEGEVEEVKKAQV